MTFPSEILPTAVCFPHPSFILSLGLHYRITPLGSAHIFYTDLQCDLIKQDFTNLKSVIIKTGDHSSFPWHCSGIKWFAEQINSVNEIPREMFAYFRRQTVVKYIRTSSYQLGVCQTLFKRMCSADSDRPGEEFQLPCI